MRIADRESSEFRMQLAPPLCERYVCFSVSIIIQPYLPGRSQAVGYQSSSG